MEDCHYWPPPKPKQISRARLQLPPNLSSLPGCQGSIVSPITLTNLSSTSPYPARIPLKQINHHSYSPSRLPNHTRFQPTSSTTPYSGSVIRLIQSARHYQPYWTYQSFDILASHKQHHPLVICLPPRADGMLPLPAHHLASTYIILNREFC